MSGLKPDRGQEAVDVINYCLDTPPLLHRAENEEEWWSIELGEHAALYIAQAIVGGSWWANDLAWMAWSYR